MALLITFLLGAAFTYWLIGKFDQWMAKELKVEESVLPWQATAISALAAIGTASLIIQTLKLLAWLVAL